MIDIKRAVVSTTTFKLDSGFMLDIVCNAEDKDGEFYEAWLWHPDIAIKSMMFGCQGMDYEQFVELAVDNSNEYTEYYEEDYMEGYVDVPF